MKTSTTATRCLSVLVQVTMQSTCQSVVCWTASYLATVQKYWSVNLTGISIGNAAAKPIPGLSATTAILDSGTHFIIASDADAKAINTVSTSLT